MTAPELTDCPSASAQIEGVIFGVLLADQDGIIRQINSAAQEILGLSSSRAVGQPVFACIKLSDESVQQRLLSAQEGLTVRDVSLNTGHTRRGVNVTSSQIASHPGWRVLTLSQASQVREDELSAASLRGPGVLAHEIKNPLAAIKGAGQLLIRKLGTDDVSLASLIVDEADRIARLIDRMQSLGSTAQEAVHPCNQHEAIRSVITAIHSGQRTDLVVGEEFDPSLPMALANRDLLEQVLLNLLGNACDAAVGNNAAVRVQTRYSSAPLVSVDADGNSIKLPIEITVIDNGSGVEPTLEDQIFEPFVSTKGGGHGLGLPLVRKLMRDMCGRVTYARRAEETHFRLHLPVASETAGSVNK